MDYVPLSDCMQASAAAFLAFLILYPLCVWARRENRKINREDDNE